MSCLYFITNNGIRPHDAQLFGRNGYGMDTRGKRDRLLESCPRELPWTATAKKLAAV